KGVFLQLQGRGEEATAEFEKARAQLEGELEELEGDDRLHSALGIAYAGLGRAEDAIREGDRGLSLMGPETDVNKSTYRMEDLAVIHAMLGNGQEAIQVLEVLLDAPGDYSGSMLARDPRFVELRDLPGFQSLLDRHGSN
ncbi:MAG: hypothetical protein KJN92_08185, partial [Gemmatimonadetes bacterium]|nr:hypothetical protein [Gemmatimonadota bacterium]